MDLNRIQTLNIKPLPLVEQVTRILTEAILAGELRGGDQLVEAELQKHFGVSRSPLRESFRELEKNGFVEIIPRKGAFVRKLTIQDIDDTFPILGKLEGFAARLALRRVTPADLAALEKALAEMEAAVSTGDANAYQEPHVRFHDVYVRASGNVLLAEILGRLRMRIIWHRFYHKYHQVDFGKYLDLHKQILELFRDPATTEDHIERIVNDSVLSAYAWIRQYVLSLV